MSKDKWLLVEIQTEELPPDVLRYAALSLCFSLDRLLTDFRPQEVPAAWGSHDQDPVYFYTPRRLALLFSSIADASVKKIERRGPRLDIALRYGNFGHRIGKISGIEGHPGIRTNKSLSKAGLGFMKSVQDFEATEKDLRVGCHNGFDYLYACRESKGDKLKDVLGGKIELALDKMKSNVEPRQQIKLNGTAIDMQQQKFMSWGSNKMEFFRPIKGITVMHGKKPLIVNVHGKKSKKHITGHHILSPSAIGLDDAKNYKRALKGKRVLVDSYDRIRKIGEQFRKVTKSGDFYPKKHSYILHSEVADMCEWPVCYMCSFDNKYLRLPEAVLISCMEKHLRCFAVQKKISRASELSPKFIYVADNKPKPRKKFIAGVERVMRARLEDSLFIYDIDLNTSEKELLSRLGEIEYFQGFGSMLDHCKRVKIIVPVVARAIGLDKISTAVVAKAADYYKADLGSLMVAEYPELEGQLVQTYLPKLPSDVKELVTMLGKRSLKSRFGIYTRSHSIHHSLVPQGDDSDIGNHSLHCLVVASEMERLVGLGKLHGLPTGARDPLALKRSLTKVIWGLSHHSKVDLKKLLERVFVIFNKYETAENNKARVFAEANQSAFIAQIINLAIKQISNRYFLRRGRRELDHNISDAVLALWKDAETFGLDVAEVQQRILALEKFAKEEKNEFNNFITTSKRLDNMSGHSHGNGKAQSAADKSSEGYMLYNKCRKVVESSQKGNGIENHLNTLRGLAEMSSTVSDFFDNVRILGLRSKDNHNLALVKYVNRQFESLVCKASVLYRGMEQ